MVVEGKGGAELGQAADGGAGGGRVDGHVEAAGVVLVRQHLHVLEEPDEGGHAEAQPRRVRLHQHDLVDVHHQEAALLAPVPVNHRHGQQVGVIWGKKKKKKLSRRKYQFS